VDFHLVTSPSLAHADGGASDHVLIKEDRATVADHFPLAFSPISTSRRVRRYPFPL
jgi:hypothetical protein